MFYLAHYPFFYSGKYAKHIMQKTYRLPYIPLVIKAGLDNGAKSWFSTASITTPDSLNEQTSLMLFQDWIARIKSGVTDSYLKHPIMPYLSIAHYPDLAGYGIAGATEVMQVKSRGNNQYEFIVKGVWDSGPIGQKSYDAVLRDMSLTEKGESTDTPPIRISAAWWDVEHQHGDYVFRRSSLSQKCPICASGLTKDKVYLKGQAEHWALTRIPIHKQTNIAII